MSKKVSIPMHEEISIRVSRFMRRITNEDFLQKRASVLAPFSVSLNPSKSAEETLGVKNVIEQNRAAINRRLSMPYWRAMQQQKIRGY